MRDYEHAANAGVMSGERGGMTAGIDISLAGRVAIGPAGQARSEAALGSRGRVALAYLVLERWRPVARDELAEVVWGAELPLPGGRPFGASYPGSGPP